MSASTANRVRVGGSGFTIFTFGGQPISFCQQVAYTSPQPVGNGMSAIQPMDEPYAVEIITPIAAGPGSITLNMFELFGSGGAASKVWDRLGFGKGTISSPFGGTTATNSSLNAALPSSAQTTNGNNFLYGAADIVDIFIAQAQQDPSAMQVDKYIRPLPLPGGSVPQAYVESYIGSIITNVVDGEQVEVGTLEIIKQITIAFRYVTRGSQQPTAFALRNAAL